MSSVSIPDDVLNTLAARAFAEMHLALRNIQRPSRSRLREEMKFRGQEAGVNIVGDGRWGRKKKRSEAREGAKI